ncbi:MATE family efflux transporter [Formosa sp. L2A11]|uniref:MATE family efflux transporter n=1 Tax=Formosa sp. L2A11 TaxID=2686363 RepID=UPI00131BC4A6|nr:MATE family efflux transporter [Formosa sp. L2A11]
MTDKVSVDLGTEPISKLIIRQSVPASIGVLVMSLNVLVDTFFVGNWIGSIAIAAINIVLPVSFFIAALGMSIGIGGSSIISRALGAKNKEKALDTFGNQIALTLILITVFVCLGLFFADEIILAFGGKGAIFNPAKVYYTIVLYGVPFLGLSMVGNNVIRAEGNPKFAMYAMMIPAFGNLIFDYILINLLDQGMAGAAWATTGSNVLGFLYVFWYFFLNNKTVLKINWSYLRLKGHVISEIASLGFVTLARQAVVSVMYLFMNNILFDIGGEVSVTAYAIVGRMLMFALFPVLGVTQGFLPIAGYNYGAEQYGRVRLSINTAIKYAAILATIIFVLLMSFPESITRMFTQDPEVLKETPYAMRWVFAATPIIALQLIGAAYFQAIGKAKPALFLTLTRQGFFFIPLILILPKFYGELGVWMSFPISDVLSTIVTGYFLRREIKTDLIKKSTITT